MVSLITLLRNNKFINQDDIKSINYRIFHMKNKMQILKNIVCKETNINPDVVNARIRNREIVQVRQLICYFAKLNNLQTLQQIGEFIGGYDHATVLHGYKTMANLNENNSEIKRLINNIGLKLELKL